MRKRSSPELVTLFLVGVGTHQPQGRLSHSFFAASLFLAMLAVV